MSVLSGLAGAAGNAQTQLDKLAGSAQALTAAEKEAIGLFSQSVGGTSKFGDVAALPPGLARQLMRELGISAGAQPVYGPARQGLRHQYGEPLGPPAPSPLGRGRLGLDVVQQGPPPEAPTPANLGRRQAQQDLDRAADRYERARARVERDHTPEGERGVGLLHWRREQSRILERNIAERGQLAQQEAQRDRYRTPEGRAEEARSASRQDRIAQTEQEFGQRNLLGRLQARLADLRTPEGQQRLRQSVERQQRIEVAKEAIAHQENVAHMGRFGAAIVQTAKALNPVAMAATAAVGGLEALAHAGSPAMGATLSGSWQLLGAEVSAAFTPALMEFAGLVQDVARAARENPLLRAAGRGAGGAIGEARDEFGTLADLTSGNFHTDRERTLGGIGSALNPFGENGAARMGMLAPLEISGIPALTRLTRYLAGGEEQQREPPLLDMPFQNRQFSGIEQLDDTIQQMAVRTPLQQQTFEAQTRQLDEMIRLLGGIDGYMQRVADQAGHPANQ